MQALVIVATSRALSRRPGNSMSGSAQAHVVARRRVKVCNSLLACRRACVTKSSQPRGFPPPSFPAPLLHPLHTKSRANAYASSHTQAHTLAPAYTVVTMRTREHNGIDNPQVTHHRRRCACAQASRAAPYWQTRLPQEREIRWPRAAASTASPRRLCPSAHSPLTP